MKYDKCNQILLNTMKYYETQTNLMKHDEIQANNAIK